LLLVLALSPAVECGFEAMTPEEHACCAAMKGECRKSIGPHCCDGESESSRRFLATKTTEEVIPAAVVVALLTDPPVQPPSATHAPGAPEATSAGPPGVPTYLFVSSFRI
jgi:hypothetical protein